MEVAEVRTGKTGLSLCFRKQIPRRPKGLLGMTNQGMTNQEGDMRSHAVAPFAGGANQA